MKGGGASTSVRREQVGDLLSVVEELKEKGERLRNNRECEQEIDWWSNSVLNV